MALQCVAFAEVLDQFSGIKCDSGIAVEMHLQKFGISFAESSVMMTSERHFGRPDGVKLALGRRFGSPGGVKLVLERRLGGQIASSWPWNGVVVALGSWCSVARSEDPGGNFV